MRNDELIQKIEQIKWLSLNETEFWVKEFLNAKPTVPQLLTMNWIIFKNKVWLRNSKYLFIVNNIFYQIFLVLRWMFTGNGDMERYVDWKAGWVEKALHRSKIKEDFIKKVILENTGKLPIH